MKQLDIQRQMAGFRTPCQSASPASGHVERSTATMKPPRLPLLKGQTIGMKSSAPIMMMVPHEMEGQAIVFKEAPIVMIVLI